MAPYEWPAVWSSTCWPSRMDSLIELPWPLLERKRHEQIEHWEEACIFLRFLNMHSYVFTCQINPIYMIAQAEGHSFRAELSVLYGFHGSTATVSELSTSRNHATHVSPKDIVNWSCCGNTREAMVRRWCNGSLFLLPSLHLHVKPEKLEMWKLRPGYSFLLLCMRVISAFKQSVDVLLAEMATDISFSTGLITVCG